MRLSRSMLASAMLLACCHKGIVAFNVSPPVTCPNGPVSITWQVDGSAVLKADPTPANWSEQVPSQGTRSVSITKDTTFTLLSEQGNLAKGSLFGSRTIQVNPQNKLLGNSAACDETTRTCTTSFAVYSVGELKAVHLSIPLFVQSGKEQSREVCVTPPNEPKACVPPGGSVSIDHLANGIWELEAQLGTNEQAKPPPQLRLTFDFGCP